MKDPIRMKSSPTHLYAAGQLSRRGFMKSLAALGISAATASYLADTSQAIAQTQAYNTKNLKASYDYIICGAGSAGCVLAAELSERNPEASILLLEAGGADDAAGILDLLWIKIYQDPSLFWLFQGLPNPLLNNRIPPLPMGRVIGGGSSVNALIYARGHKADYDGWAQQLGDDRWSYQNVVKTFLAMEDYEGPASPLRGVGGKFHSSVQTDIAPLARDMRSAGGSFGLPVVEDINAETMERDGGIAYSNIIEKDGKRGSVARAFLHPVLASPNITVLTNATVLGLAMEGTRATGVSLRWRDETRVISASSRVILSSGALKTPQILMLSGIGPAAHISKFGISPKVDLPGVGENFHDHPLVASCAWEAPYDFDPMANGSQCVYFANVNSPAGAPDLMPVQMQIPFVSPENASSAKMPERNLWVIVPGLAKPRSRGSVYLKSDNIMDDPAVDTRFLSVQHDFDTLLLGIEQAREIGNSAAMRDHVLREVLPGPKSRDDLKEFVRNGCSTYYHMCGTARMGTDTDEMAVTLSDLSVRGVENLSIADTSIFPDVPRSNTMVPAAMVGYKLADILTGR
ncbi:GMC family oxidoreductase N-terminal domain-containing protein [Pseudotabrizicola sp. 4114]|uniref:GMC family oxidoreductase n=1 Tax=Pseudotabrizicola sp. 4114 TaxID=2817731 RepID=UPI002860B538|nr:choline dehydrogenase [Pseudorhodobacter sp. 4114]